MTLVCGAGASLAAPARLPLFAQIREGLFCALAVPQIPPAAWRDLAPEALLSRLEESGADVDASLQAALSGGEPNALHHVAAKVLSDGGAVWTPNFDELIERAAAELGVAYHRLLPGDDAGCRCERGHLMKPHGTLGAGRLLARAEDVLVPLARPWLDRLASDLTEASVGIVGYAGADIDLRVGLRDALAKSRSAVWFGHRDFDADTLRRRFGQCLDAGYLELALSDRPDLAFLDWAQRHGLTQAIAPALLSEAKKEVSRDVPALPISSDEYLRGRILDDFSEPLAARARYRRALRRGPKRRRAASALLSSGLIHGAPWRRPWIVVLRLATRTPLRVRWAHRQLLLFLTWNAQPDERMAAVERALRREPDDLALLLAAANATKEIDPSRGASLSVRARQIAEAARPPRAPSAAWATFIASFSYRWLGDLKEASLQAEHLGDGLDALAGPSWVAWGHFETAAIACLQGDPRTGAEGMMLAHETFAAAGSSIFTFDALCGAIACYRAAGQAEAQRQSYSRAKDMLERNRQHSRFAREVLMIEDAEFARHQARLSEAEDIYRQLAKSPTAAQRLLGLLGWGEVQRQRGEPPEAARAALAESRRLAFAYGEVHALVTLGLAGAMPEEVAEEQIASSVFAAPQRDDAIGLLRFCQGADPERHTICFP